jgi:hypothetical protein
MEITMEVFHTVKNIPLENYHQKITVSKGPYKKAIEEGTVEKGGW